MSEMDRLGEIVQLPCDLITRSPYQARRHFPDDYIQELSASIRKEGKNLQPILVRRKKHGGGYELIAGECRWRASLLAGFSVINGVVMELADADAHRISLTENIKRKDLNPLEEAEGITAYMEEWGVTQEEAAVVFNISRSKLANRVRLLKLAEEVKEMLLFGDIEEGVAKSLVALKEFQQIQIARKVVTFGWSVREVEREVKKIKDIFTESVVDAPRGDVDIQWYEQELSERVGTPVKIHHKQKGRGEIVISYFSPEHLEGLFEGFKRE